MIKKYMISYGYRAYYLTGKMRLSLLLLLVFFSFSASAIDSKQFIQALEKKDWNTATTIKDNDLKTLATWIKLTTEASSDFYELTSFITKHPHWPKQNILKRKVEESNYTNCKNSDILSWFEAHPPQTIVGQKKYLSLLKNAQMKDKYAKLIWQKDIFNNSEENTFLNNYRNIITESDSIYRMNYLLSNNKSDQAIKLLPSLSPKYRTLYQARINLHKLADIYNKQDDEKNLIKTLITATKLTGADQSYFWSYKAKLIRPLIEQKEYKTAYLFASTHGHISAKEYTEAEWLAGWIALRFLNQPQLAIDHFTNFYQKVKLPISIARGGYWLGRSYEKLNDSVKSKYWYEVAAKNYISFYGQLAACKINNCKVDLPKEPKILATDLESFNKNSLVKAALTLEKSKYSYLMQELLFKAIDDSKQIGEITLISKIGFKLNQFHLSVETAKQASYKNILLINSNYPIFKAIHTDHEVDKALVLALIRQESVFNHQAISSAGAMGLMQLMPHVAKETASNIKIKYHKDKLLSDTHFNTRIGITHLDKLLNNYNDSYILTIAAYNAGDKAAKQWIENNGDPRKMKNIDEIIDWLEKISFHETRNYVQRVLEGKSIYHLILTKQNKLPILTDLLP